MPAWTAGSVTYSDPSAMNSATGLVAGRYWMGEVRVGTPLYERRAYGFPGVDGLGIKSFGYRGRELSGTVVYVQSGLTALRNAINSDRDALANSTFSSTPPGGSALPNCQLETLSDGEIRAAGNGLYIMKTELVLRQLRQ